MQTKRILILMVCLALLTAGCSGSAPVFKTPEDAITHYFQGLAQSDFNKISQACAINEMSEKFKFDLYTERLGYLIPFQAQAPAEYPLYVEINKTQLSSQIFSRVRIFAYSLLSDEKVAEGKVVQIDAERTAAFMKDVDPKRLSGLELKKIGLPNKSLMSNAKYLENADKMARAYGADESTERVALFSFGGNDYYVGFTLLRYGDNWKIRDQTSPLANTNALGAPEKTTAEGFERMINGD
jgi:PBP1b-binding outer membrane lipoprotein LpoB